MAIIEKQSTPHNLSVLTDERRRIIAEGVDLGVAPREFGWEKTEPPPWWQQPDEPDMWYYRFERFFLMQGPSRSLQAAYRLWILAEKGPEALAQSMKALKDVSNRWREIALEWSWRERAAAYDGEINRLIMKKVEASRRRLQDATPLAVEALIESLQDPRYRIQAAKEILDRAGLPAVVREIRTTLGFTTEDLAEAEKEVREWEAQILAQNG